MYKDKVFFATISLIAAFGVACGVLGIVGAMDANSPHPQCEPSSSMSCIPLMLFNNAIFNPLFGSPYKGCDQPATATPAARNTAPRLPASGSSPVVE
jgi:hypothetical protein